MTKIRAFWEGFIAVVIIMAISQIFLEDLASILDWNVPSQKLLIITGFLFDLIFTIEFIIRSFHSRKEHGWWYYFVHGKGWIDFMSSIPLILLSSGPLMIGMFHPGGLLAIPFLGEFNILKILRVTRFTRFMRMLRILRILKLMKNVDQQAEEGEVSPTTLQLEKTIAISVLTMILILVLTPFFPKIFHNMDEDIKIRKMEYISLLKDWNTSVRKQDLPRVQYLNSVLKEETHILYMFHAGQTVINNMGDDEEEALKLIPQKYFYIDFHVLNYLNFKLWYSVKDIVANNARINLMVSLLIVGTIASLMIFYKDPALKNNPKN